MSFGKRLIATAGVAALIATTALSGAAQDEPSAWTDVDIAVTSKGVLSVQVKESKAFNDIEYSFRDQTVRGALLITVTDERGTAEGWTFNLRATDFEGSPDGPGDSFPVSGLRLWYGGVDRGGAYAETASMRGRGIRSSSARGPQILRAAPG